MRISEITESDRYRGKKIATHLVGKTGKPIPDDIKKLADKHIRARSNTTVKPHYPYYIIQYDDLWYDRVFGVDNFKEFWKRFSPYYTIG